MRHWNLQTILCLSLLLLTAPFAHAAKPDALVRLPGHVLPALAKATPVAPQSKAVAEEPLTLTLVLKRDDPAGFEHYLRDVYDPKSPTYRKFITQSELSDRFGPSRKAYDDVLSYLQSNGFSLVEGSANRLTLTVRGTRTETDQAFNIHISDYTIDHKSFYANDSDPALPKKMARHVETVAGLANLATVSPTADIISALQNGFCEMAATLNLITYAFDHPLATQKEFDDYKKKKLAECITGHFSLTTTSGVIGIVDPPAPAWQGVDGTGQTIGVVAFDTFPMSDVSDFINFIGHPAAQINKLSQVHVNGGASPGSNQNEVLLDIDMVLAIAPGANIVVFDAPFTGAGTSFQNVFNAMINSGVTIISNSWAYCEDQTTLADVQSIDIILQTAAASGISVIAGSGDHGSTCLDGSPNTAHVPATSPHITAVGGTSLTVGPGYTYGGETWWNNGSGQGGFGVSKFFSRPSYQDGMNGSVMRSIPDIAANADPSHGYSICQASAGGCPTGLSNGGTSSTAPAWAAFAALLNQAQGSNLGFLNPLIYPFANTDAFHNAASMGTDFAHVGLGSANLAHLHQRLTGQTTGPVSASVSEVGISIAENTSPPPLPGAPADGIFQTIVVVKLADANGNVVSGKTVSLAASGGNAQISPASGVSALDNGAVTFTITDLTPETLTFTATNTSDGIVLDQKARITFVTPPAASAGISAFPPNVAADGISTTTLTVTLKDSLNRPTPGKQINLSQGTGHSIIAGPNPSVTDANGQITYTATNQVNEAVTYTAVDVTDGDLPIPGNPQVTFSGGSGSACGQNTPLPVGQNGYTVTPFVTGIVAGPLSFGGINFGGCTGISIPAFLNDSVFITNLLNGDLFKLGATGGAASTANRLSTQGPTLSSPVVGKDGRLYAARIATTGDFNTGAILELDPTTGALIRNVVSNLRCPFSLAIDPLSGDLFFDDGCSGNGSDDPTIHRVRNPGSATPTLEVYATLPATPNGKISFAPNGTLYVDTGYFSATPTISVVSGTNVPGPATITTLPGVNSFFWVHVAESDANGAARSLIITTSLGLELMDIATQTKTLLAQNIGGGEIGPDGCLYSIIEGTVYKVTNPTGGCSFVAGGASPALSLALAANSPSPVQGNPETFNATLQKVSAPEGTPVFFSVTGANPQIKLVRADANGKAALTYTAVFAGKDTITATATINGVTLSSNPVQVTWTAGKHVTFLTLNPSPTSGTPGVPVSVIASLTDISVSPAASVPSQAVTFTLGSAQCVGTTNAQGIATCQIVPSVVGMGTLTATFAGSNQLVGSTASTGFNVLVAAGPSCVPSPEVCDGKDNNCNGQIDEGNPGGGASCTTGLPGVCSPGTLTCTGGALVCRPTTQSSPEVCDGKDNNCNSQIDEGLGTLSCGVGACARTVNACGNGAPQTCVPGTPVAEICGDGIDQDCNGSDLVCTPPPTAQCPHGQGYWKNHPTAWSVTSLQLGTQTYSKAELLSLLGKPSSGDASLILTRQLIAAKLNVAAGVVATPIAATITDADQRLSAFTGKLPYKVQPSSVAGKALVKAADKLADYNDGDLTPRCKKHGEDD